MQAKLRAHKLGTVLIKETYMSRHSHTIQADREVCLRVLAAAMEAVTKVLQVSSMPPRPALTVLLAAATAELEGNHTTVSDVRECLGISQAAASRTVASLEGSAFIRTFQPPHDGRVTCIELTRKGHRLINDVLDETAAVLKAHQMEMRHSGDP